jgi:SAM-dependent methyltransferase
MRRAIPSLEKNFLSRFFSKSIIGRGTEFLQRPLYSVGKLKERWYECSHPDLPLLTPKANLFLAHNISRDSIGFEWGSGGSTIWFARHCRRLISIEHAPDWFGFVSSRLQEMSLNVDFRLIPLDHEESLPTVPCYDKPPRYVSQISEFPDRSFDFCLVDGHYRQACIRAALRKLRPGGLLIVDDTQWMPLAEWGVSTDWEVAMRGRSYLKDTTIWKAKS